MLKKGYLLFPKVLFEEQIKVTKGATRYFDAFLEKFHEITRKPKTNIGRARREWKKLSVNERCLSLNHIDEYYDNLTDIKYCMQAASYLSNKAFMNEYDY